MSWTGGWTNRVQVKNFSFGLDLLYLLHEYRLRATPSDWKKNNHVRLNHVYAGYSVKTRSNKRLELYISSRNALQSDEPNFFDARRYYGAGFKLLL